MPTGSSTGSDLPPASSGPSDTPSPVEPSPSPTLVSGVARGESDVSGEEAGAFGQGWVVAVPVVQTGQLWEAAGLDANPPEPGYGQFAIERQVLAEIGATVVALAVDGSFALDVQPGTFTFCLAEGDDPIRVLGCREHEIGTAPPLLITFGEAGLRVSGG